MTKWLNSLYLVALAAGCLLVYTGWVWLTIQPNFWEEHYISFGKFYSVGRVVFSADRGKLYDPYYQRQRLSDFVNPKVLPEVREWDGVPIFPKGYAEHPPHFFMLYAPFSVFSPLTALRVYTVVCLVVGFAALIWLTKQVGTLNTRQTLALALGGVASFPSRYALMLGQPTWAVLGLFALYIGMWLRRNDRVSGLALALMTIKPQYPIFFGLPALATRRWKVVLWAIAGGLALLGACIVTVGWKQMADYVPMISHFNSSTAYVADDFGMPSVRGIVSSNINGPLGVRVGFISTVLALLFMAWMWWQTEKRGMDARWAFCITLLCSVLFSPHIFRYDELFLLLCPALTLTSVSLGWSKADAAAQPAFTAWRYLWLLYPLYTFLEGVIIPRTYTNVNNVVEFVTNLVLFGLAVRLWWTSGGARTASEPEAA